MRSVCPEKIDFFSFPEVNYFKEICVTHSFLATEKLVGSIQSTHLFQFFFKKIFCVHFLFKRHLLFSAIVIFNNQIFNPFRVIWELRALLKHFFETKEKLRAKRRC